MPFGVVSGVGLGMGVRESINSSLTMLLAHGVVVKYMPQSKLVLSVLLLFACCLCMLCAY